MFAFLNNLKISNLTEDKVLKIHKYVNFILIAVLAYLSASLIMIFINNKLDSMAKKEVAKTVPVVEAKSIYEVVVSRNLFNSNNEIPDDEVINQAGVKSSLPINLVGTIVVNEAARSVAAIEIKKDNKIEPFVIGDKIMDEAEVVSISRHKVVIKNLKTGAMEYIEIEDILPDLSTRTYAAPISEGIKISGDTVEIERGEVSKAMANINDLLMQATAVPYREGGEIVGFRLLGIAPGSLYEKIGAQNGDIIRSVNGETITSPAAAMQMYQQLQTRSTFEIVVTRGGEEKKFNLNIR